MDTQIRIKISLSRGIIIRYWSLFVNTLRVAYVQPLCQTSDKANRDQLPIYTHSARLVPLVQ